MEASLMRAWNVVGYASRLPRPPADLSALMTGYQAGDADAFREFHATLRPVLGAYLLSLGAPEPSLDALLDDVFLQIHAARRSWSPGSPVEPWAKAIARYVLSRSRGNSVMRMFVQP